LSKWQDAIDDKLWALQEKYCFAVVDKEEAEGRQIVDSTWVFKRKRRPDGTLLKYKACLCIRGDQMYKGLKEGKGAKETLGYSTVIDWGTLQIILSLTIQYNLHTMQVDFKNAFIQAPLDRPMYMNLPPGLNDTLHLKGKILHLKHSLYGHWYAAKLFYEAQAKSQNVSKKSIWKHLQSMEKICNNARRIKQALLGPATWHGINHVIGPNPQDTK